MAGHSFVHIHGAGSIISKPRITFTGVRSVVLHDFTSREAKQFGMSRLGLGVSLI